MYKVYIKFGNSNTTHKINLYLSTFVFTMTFPPQLYCFRIRTPQVIPNLSSIFTLSEITVTLTSNFLHFYNTPLSINLIIDVIILIMFHMDYLNLKTDSFRSPSYDLLYT